MPDKISVKNPIIPTDCPDPDIIRVDDVYYMVITTMHFFPGCEILRSYNLINWEHASYVYECLDSTDGQRLIGDKNIYGKGMWAASLRYHNNQFYITFVANDTHKTYLYTSSNINGPWHKQNIEGFYHDCSLLFDDDGKVYIAYGNREIFISELNEDLTGLKEGGFHRLVVKDRDDSLLGYEGTHFYKINGIYYLFFIHAGSGEWFRSEWCYRGNSLTDEFTGIEVLKDDRGYCNQGVAQGGIVETPDGEFYSVLFQDSGAVGRMPILIPVKFENDWPVFGNDGKIPESFIVKNSNNKYLYTSLLCSDDFKGELKSAWQFNHEPNLSLISHDTQKGIITVKTDKIVENLTMARNMLTQRMHYPYCSGEVTVDSCGLSDGDYAGLCILQGLYAFIGIKVFNNKKYIVMLSKQRKENIDSPWDSDGDEIQWYESELPGDINNVSFKIEADFTDMKDEAEFYYLDKYDKWIKIGITHKMQFLLDHFTGARFGLAVYSTIQYGGSAGFSDFKLNID